MLAVVLRERDQAVELRLVGERNMGAEAISLATRAAALGAPGAVLDDDGAGRTGSAGHRGRGDSARNDMAASDDHERISSSMMAAKPVSRGGKASGQARR